MTLLALLGTNDVAFRHAVRACRPAVHRGGDSGSSGTGLESPSVPGGTAFFVHPSPSPDALFGWDGRLAGGSAGSSDGVAEGDRRRWRLLGKGVVGEPGRGRWRGRAEWASRTRGRHGRGGFGSSDRSISPEEGGDGGTIELGSVQCAD